MSFVDTVNEFGTQCGSMSAEDIGNAVEAMHVGAVKLLQMSAFEEALTHLVESLRDGGDTRSAMKTAENLLAWYHDLVDKVESSELTRQQ